MWSADPQYQENDPFRDGLPHMGYKMLSNRVVTLRCECEGPCKTINAKLLLG
jgi:hypothetical protein